MKQIENMSEAIEHARLLREKLLSDTARPGYHFAIPEDIGIPGDSNGAFYANGRYHLMYLYSCRSDGFRYGHISSIDLIHWRSHKDILGPDELDGGIFSGGAFVDDDGTAYITYWGLNKEGIGKGVGGIRIAKSSDMKNHYETWEKMPEYAIESTDFGMTEIKGNDGSSDLIGSADPSNIWKKDGKYYMLTGNLLILNKYRNQPDAPKRYLGDWVDLFCSADLIKWEFVKRFYQRDSSNQWTDESEDDMCPSFLPLPKSKSGGEMSDKYLQLFIAHNKGCQYYIGTYDKKNDVFLPEVHGRMSWADNTFFAPEALIAPDGRQIMWSWLLDNRADDLQYGWTGVYGLPRSLWLREDNTLGIAPIEELKLLRYNPSDFLDGVNGRSCEIRMTINMNNACKAGLNVRCSPDDSEFTLLYYDTADKSLVFDSSLSGSQGRPCIERAPFKLNECECLKLTVYIDHSVVEVYANDRQAICRRVYPYNAESTAVKFYQDGDAEIKEIHTWEIMPSNMY